MYDPLAPQGTPDGPSRTPESKESPSAFAPGYVPAQPPTATGVEEQHLTVPAKSRILPVALVAGLCGVVIGVAGTYGVITVMNDRAAARQAAQLEAVEQEAADARAALLTTALEECDLDVASTGFSLGDGGHTLRVDMRGEDDFSGASYSDIDCVLAELEVPESVSAHIGQTTSMDGRQTEEWGDVEFSWSYHPDRGLDGVLTVSSD